MGTLRYLNLSPRCPLFRHMTKMCRRFSSPSLMWMILEQRTPRGHGHFPGEPATRALGEPKYGGVHLCSVQAFLLPGSGPFQFHPDLIAIRSRGTHRSPIEHESGISPMNIFSSFIFVVENCFMPNQRCTKQLPAHLTPIFSLWTSQGGGWFLDYLTPPP